MKILLVYDSVFGNTEKVAHAIADGLRGKGLVELIRPDGASPERLAGVDLLVVGSPTRGFRPTEGLTALLKGLRPGALQGVRVAAFDTRILASDIKQAALRFMVNVGGYAAAKIADRLSKAGAALVAPPEGFYVEDTEGPLKPGELERATAWGAKLASAA